MEKVLKFALQHRMAQKEPPSKKELDSMRTKIQAQQDKITTEAREFAAQPTLLSNTKTHSVFQGAQGHAGESV